MVPQQPISSLLAPVASYPATFQQVPQKHFGPQDADVQGNWVSRWNADANYIRSLSDDMLLSFMAEHARQNTRQQELLNNANIQPAVNSSFNSPLQQLPLPSQQQDIVNALQSF